MNNSIFFLEITRIQANSLNPKEDHRRSLSSGEEEGA